MRVVRDPIRYGFATGRARVLETRLLGKSTFERLLDAPNFEEQRRILSETPYGGFLESARTTDDVERALADSLADMYADFLDKANLPDALRAFLRAQHEFANVRAHVKAEVLGIPPEELADVLAEVSVDALSSGDGLTADMVQALREVRSLITDESEDIDPLLVDPAVDAVLYRRLRSLADESKSAFLVKLTERMIDVANAKVFMRARIKEVPVAQVERLLVAGGSIGTGRFVELYRLPLADAAAAVAAFRMFGGVDPGILLDLRRFDVAAEAVVARAVREARMVAIGPEPVVAYAMAREAETTVLRSLLIGRLAGVSTEVLRERIRDVV